METQIGPGLLPALAGPSKLPGPLRLHGWSCPSAGAERAQAQWLPGPSLLGPWSWGWSQKAPLKLMNASFPQAWVEPSPSSPHHPGTLRQGENRGVPSRSCSFGVLSEDALATGSPGWWPPPHPPWLCLPGLLLGVDHVYMLAVSTVPLPMFDIPVALAHIAAKFSASPGRSCSGSGSGCGFCSLCLPSIPSFPCFSGLGSHWGNLASCPLELRS